MTIHEARLILELNKTHSYRALSEVYYAVEDDNFGDQLAGMDLCRDAAQMDTTADHTERKDLCYHVPHWSNQDISVTYCMECGAKIVKTWVAVDE